MPSSTRFVAGAAMVVVFAALALASTLGSPASRMFTARESTAVSDRPDAAEAARLDDRRREAVHDSYLEKSVEHFRILYEGSTQQSIGAHAARVLEREYPRITQTLNSTPSGPITVILYTNREFQEITRSPAWATGVFDGRIRVAVGGSISPSDLDRVLTHELVHAVVASAAPRSVPAWLNEGLATYLESGDVRWTPDVLRRAASIQPLESLAQGFVALDAEAALVAYAESGVAAEILARLLGGNLGAFVQLVGGGMPLDDALLEFQVQPNAFHAEWRRRVGAR